MDIVRQYMEVHLILNQEIMVMYIIWMAHSYVRSIQFGLQLIVQHHPYGIKKQFMIIGSSQIKPMDIIMECHQSPWIWIMHIIGMDFAKWVMVL